MTDGSSASVTFVRPTTTVETSSGITSACGSSTYSIHSDNSGTNFSYASGWAVITEASEVFTLTVDTTVDSSLIANENTVTIPIYIKSTLTDYTGYNRESYTLVNFVIGEITCDCTALTWDNPSGSVVVGSAIVADSSASTQTLILPEANTSARSTNTGFDKCYLDSNDCATTGAFDSL